MAVSWFVHSILLVTAGATVSRSVKPIPRTPTHNISTALGRVSLPVETDYRNDFNRPGYRAEAVTCLITKLATDSMRLLPFGRRDAATDRAKTTHRTNKIAPAVTDFSTFTCNTDNRLPTAGKRLYVGIPHLIWLGLVYRNVIDPNRSTWMVVGNNDYL